jgi:hypothetical protein
MMGLMAGAGKWRRDRAEYEAGSAESWSWANTHSPPSGTTMDTPPGWPGCTREWSMASAAAGGR